MSQNGKIMPNLEQNRHCTKALNLTVLQRIDQCVEEILITAAHVTFYQFNIDSTQWSRKDVEGSLFVVKRNTQPRFQFIVMNRLSADNLVENLLGDFEYEVQLPYLLYRNATQEVNGIWFYNPRECEEVANLFSRILNAYAKVPTKLTVATGKSSEFEELEAVPTMAVMDGPLEPSSATMSDATDVPIDHLFTTFFGATMNLGSGTSGTLVPQAAGPPAAPTIQVPTAPPPSASNIFSTLFGNPDNSHLSRTETLVKPSSFLNPAASSPALMVPPFSSSIPTAPPLDPSGNLQRLYGTPMLQPFPPPTPSSSLTPVPAPTLNYEQVITREKVRDALVMLFQDDQFIDKFHRALLNTHNS